MYSLQSFFRVKLLAFAVAQGCFFASNPHESPGRVVPLVYLSILEDVSRACSGRGKKNRKGFERLNKKYSNNLQPKKKD